MWARRLQRFVRARDLLRYLCEASGASLMPILHLEPPSEGYRRRNAGVRCPAWPGAEGDARLLAYSRASHEGLGAKALARCAHRRTRGYCGLGPQCHSG